jgi:hypothetical protein
MDDAIVEHPSKYAAKSAWRAIRPRIPKAAAGSMMRWRCAVHDREVCRRDATPINVEATAISAGISL